MKGSFDITVLCSLLQLARLHCSAFFTKARSYLPIGLWGLVLYMMHQGPPPNIVQGYAALLLYLFVVMVWFSYAFLSSFDMVTEHLLILRINSRFLYAISKILFLVAVSLAAGIVGSLVPVVIEAAAWITNTAYMPYGIRVSDFFSGVFLHFIVGNLGVAAAFLFHPNPSKENEIVLIASLFLFTVLALVKHQFFNLQGHLRYILYVFTPVYEIISLFSGSYTFTAGDLALSAAKGGIYFIIAVAVGCYLYNKRVYGPLLAATPRK